MQHRLYCGWGEAASKNTQITKDISAHSLIEEIRKWVVNGI